MEETIDEAAKREFRFSFRQQDNGRLHEVFEALKDFGGGIELVSGKGVVWTPKDSENLLRRYFGNPGEVHTARARTEKEIGLYRSIFANFQDYVEYGK